MPAKVNSLQAFYMLFPRREEKSITCWLREEEFGLQEH